MSGTISRFELRNRAHFRATAVWSRICCWAGCSSASGVSHARYKESDRHPECLPLEVVNEPAGILRSTSFVFARVAISKAELSLAQGPPPDSWRTFEVTTRAEVLNPTGETKIWLPAALIRHPVSKDDIRPV